MECEIYVINTPDFHYMMYYNQERISSDYITEIIQSIFKIRGKDWKINKYKFQVPLITENEIDAKASTDKVFCFGELLQWASTIDYNH